MNNHGLCRFIGLPPVGCQLGRRHGSSDQIQTRHQTARENRGQEFVQETAALKTQFHKTCFAWKWKVKVKSFSCVRLLATSWTAAYEAPPFMGFSRQEYWSGLPLPSQLEKTSHQQNSPQLLTVLHWIGSFLTSGAEALNLITKARPTSAYLGSNISPTMNKTVFICFLVGWGLQHPYPWRNAYKFSIWLFLQTTFK